MFLASQTPRIQAKSAVALVLTFAAGCVDIVGYLTIYKVFTAHMTGDTVHFGNNLVMGHWFDAGVAGSIIAAFLLGSIVGRTIIEVGWRARLRSIASATLLLEAGLIALVIPGAHAHGAEVTALGWLALLAAAMGMQTATLTRIGAMTVHTTFVTGMLNKLAQLISQALFLGYDIRHGRDARQERDNIVRQAQFIFSIWVVYLLGAASGTWLQSVSGSRCLVLPVCLIVSAIVIDHWMPLAIEEEQDQA